MDGEPAPEQREVLVEAVTGVVVRCLLSAGTRCPLRCPTKVASYGLVAHFPSCSPVAVVVVVAHVFEQRLIA